MYIRTNIEREKKDIYIYIIMKAVVVEKKAKKNIENFHRMVHLDIHVFFLFSTFGVTFVEPLSPGLF